MCMTCMQEYEKAETKGEDGGVRSLDVKIIKIHGKFRKDHLYESQYYAQLIYIYIHQ